MISILKSKFLILGFVMVAVLLIPVNDAFADHAEVAIITVDESGFSQTCAEAQGGPGCYTPVTATVEVGGVVTMTNTDPTGVHTFTSGTVNGFAPSPDGTFDTGVLMSGNAFEWIPTEAGEVPYYCMLHTWMIGTIIVQEAHADDNAAEVAAAAEAAAAEAEAAAADTTPPVITIPELTTDQWGNENLELSMSGTTNFPTGSWTLDVTDNVGVADSACWANIMDDPNDPWISSSQSYDFSKITNPPSGQKFPIGHTQISCAAYDAAGNRSESNFAVVVTHDDPIGFVQYVDKPNSFGNTADATTTIFSSANSAQSLHLLKPIADLLTASNTQGMLARDAEWTLLNGELEFNDFPNSFYTLMKKCYPSGGGQGCSEYQIPKPIATMLTDANMAGMWERTDPDRTWNVGDVTVTISDPDVSNWSPGSFNSEIRMCSTSPSGGTSCQGGSVLKPFSHLITESTLNQAMFERSNMKILDAGGPAASAPESSSADTPMPTVTSTAYLNDTSPTGRTLKLTANDWTNDIGSFQTSIIMPDGSYFLYSGYKFHFWFGDTRSTITHFPIPEDWVSGNYNVEWNYPTNNSWNNDKVMSSVTVPALLSTDTTSTVIILPENYQVSPSSDWDGYSAESIVTQTFVVNVDDDRDYPYSNPYQIDCTYGSGMTASNYQTLDLIFKDSFEISPYPDGSTQWRTTFEIENSFDYGTNTIRCTAIDALSGNPANASFVITVEPSADTTPSATSNFFFESLDITGDSDVFGPAIIVVVGESWHVTPTLAWEGTLPDSFPTGEPVIHGEIRYMEYANGTSAPSEQMGGTLYGSKNWSMISDGSVDYNAKTITLDTWSGLFDTNTNWPVGGYLVTITADTGNVLSETNESDNVIERLDIWSSCDHPPWDADVCVTDSPSADITPPVISVPNNLTFTGINYGSYAGIGKVLTSPEFASAGNVTAIDDIDGNIPVSCDGWYGINWQEELYFLGTTTITCTATDSSENEGSASFTITVTEDSADTTPPDMPQILANHTITTVAESGFSQDCVDTGCYTPSTITVDVGDLINMTNTDPTGVHTFTSGTVNGFTPNPYGIFDSGVLMSGDSFAWTPQNTVDSPIPYYCMLHTWMVGTIVVGDVDVDDNAEEAAAEAAALAEAEAAEAAAEAAALAEAEAAEAAAAALAEAEAAELAAAEAADNTPPEFEKVNNILVDATTSNGAVVNYELPQAIDDDSGVELGPDCSPASGSFFQIGTTEVTCYAADWAENIGTTSFTVTVESPITIPVEIPTDVSITIGKPVYNTDEAIFVTGIATPFTENNISIQVEDSSDNVVLVEQITPESSGIYTGIIFPNFLWSTSGNYTMSATYGNSTANTSFGFEFIESVIDEYVYPTGITLQTNTSMYAIGDTITIESALTDVGSDYQIGIFVEDPTGELRVIQFLNTDDSGSVSLSLKAQDNWIPGKYFVIASDTLAYDTLGDSENTRESVSFDLVKPIPEITISPTVTTTESGNAITSYDAGDMAYFSTSLLSESTSDVLVTINVVDSDDTTLGVAFFKSIIGKGDSEIVLGFKIPEDAADGAAKIYVNTYTDWIDQGGIVIGSELLSEVNIEGVIIEVVEETIIEEVVDEIVLPENTIPRLSTVTDITQSASFTTGSVVSYSLPLATSGATTLDATCTPAPGSMFSIGSTQVTCTATNDFGNTGMTSFMVTINPILQTADQSLSVKVGKDLYNNLEPLFVTGSVGTVTGEPINLEVRDTQNNLISIEQVTPKESSVYSAVLTSNELWDNTGEYTIIAKYEGVIALDTFEFELVEVEEVIPEKIPTSLFIDTLDSAYVLGDVVGIGVNLVDAGAGESILLEVRDSQNDQVLLQSLNTDSDGIAVFLHQLDSSGEPGVYSVTAVSDEWSFSNSENFIAVAQIPDITIGDVVSTLHDGTEVDSFESGDMGYFQTPVISESVSDVLITVNIFDVENTPLGLAYFNSKVVDDTFDIVLGLQIPEDAVPGLATVYINTFTDWPNEGGVPILEQQVSFIEISPASTTSLTVSSDESEQTAEVELIPITGNISVSTESEFYTTGNSIVISGSIQNLTEYEQAVVILIVSSDGNIVTIDQVLPDSSGNYSTTVTAGGTMNSNGEYEVRAQYGGSKITSTFDFTRN